jgi:phage gp29-like protein
LKPGSSIFSPTHLRYLRSVRGTMLRSLSGDSLANALDSFEAGNLRAAAQLWQSMTERDWCIANVKAKREKSVSRRDWQVLTVDDSGEAKRQAKVLTDFWNNVKAVDAFDLNKRGGFSLLVRQMMQAVSFKYQAHHLVWTPGSDALRATFEAVPLSFFENQTGRLRFCKTGLEYSGEEMPQDEWMVHCGDGLMVAGSIGYFCKRNALADFMAFSDKFGMPGILARTSQGKDTPGGIAMAEAAESFGQDWAAVLYGDDSSGKIELIQAAGNAAGLPMPALIEMVERRLTALWRGADLSSMSSSQGQGTGASLQEGETDLIEQDDALSISERLNEIEEIVLRWWFGPKVKVKAYIRLIVPQSEDLKLLLEATDKLVNLGAPIAIADILERFGFATPKDGTELLGKREQPTENSEQPTENSQINADQAEDAFLAKAGKLLAKANREDRENLVGGLKAVLSSPEGTQLNALAAFVEQLPDNIGQDAAQVRAWEVLLASALVNGWAGSQPSNE